MNDDQKKTGTELAAQTPQHLSVRASLVKRGLQDLSELARSSVDWDQPTLVGWLARPMEHAATTHRGMKRVRFGCDLYNLTERVQELGEDISLFVRSKTTGQITAKTDARILPLGPPKPAAPNEFIRIQLDFDQLFPEGMPLQDCVRALLSDIDELLAHDATRRSVILLRTPGGHFRKKSVDLLLAGQPDAALAALDLGLDMTSWDAELWSNKCALLSMHQRNEDALQCIDRAIALEPSNPRHWANKCAPLDGLNRTEEQLACWRHVAELAPEFDDHMVWGNIACCLYDLGRYEEAVEAFNSQLARTPEAAECLLEKGIALKRIGRIEEAVGAYDEHLKVKPDSVPGWKNKGIALLTLGKYEAALESCDQGLSLDPDNDQRLDLLNDRGLALQNLHRPDEALKCFDEALSLEPKETGASHASARRTWRNKAKLLDDLGRYEEALACDNYVSQWNPDMPQSWEDKARRLRMLGRLEEAKECDRYARGLEIDFRPHTVDWANPTITGKCFKRKQNYRPSDLPGQKIFYFQCEMQNITDFRQCPRELRIFLGSRETGRLREVAGVIDMSRDGKPANIDLGPKRYAMGVVEFEAPFPDAKPPAECLAELFGDAKEILARDHSGRIRIVLTVW
jgi:tetratricopeptide (TPR) repeat protein